MNTRNRLLASLTWPMLLLVASCHGEGSNAGNCPGCGTGGSPNLGTGGIAGRANNSVDAGDADASGCPEPTPGCDLRGSGGVFVTGPWFGWQLPDCVVNFDTHLGSDIYLADILVDCTPHYFTGENDQGFMWEVGPAWESDKGTMVTVTLTLSGEACDLVRANSDARVYVNIFTNSCPIVIGPA